MKEYFKVTAALTLFILGAIGVLTFVRNYDKQPSLILTSPECASPCWYGITPGQSTSSQVYSALDRIEGVDKDRIFESDTVAGKPFRITWYFKKPVEDGIGSVRIQNDLVTALSITTVNSLKTADLFDKLGEPEKYWTEIGQRDSGEQFLDIMLLAPSNGYAAELVIDMKPGSDQVEIKGSTPVFWVTYFSPGMYQEVPETRILLDKQPSRRTFLQEWTGYGSIPVSRES
jgi:hypothetical protein